MRNDIICYKPIGVIRSVEATQNGWQDAVPDKVARRLGKRGFRAKSGEAG